MGNMEHKLGLYYRKETNIHSSYNNSSSYLQANSLAIKYANFHFQRSNNIWSEFIMLTTENRLHPSNSQDHPT